jgi:hypothetical protein
MAAAALELRWLQADSGYAANTYAGALWYWRFRIGVGFTYG